MAPGDIRLSPFIALLSILANVIVSSRVSDVRSAQQIGSLVILPSYCSFVLVLTQSATSSILLLLALSGLIAASTP